MTPVDEAATNLKLHLIKLYGDQALRKACIAMANNKNGRDVEFTNKLRRAIEMLSHEGYEGFADSYSADRY
jgi:hypothetical protein